MISQREIDQLRRDMMGLAYCSVSTDLLKELLHFYEENRRDIEPPKLVKKSGQKTDKPHTDD